MNRSLSVMMVALLALCSAGVVVGQDKPEPKTSGYRLLMITQSAGFKHGSVNRKEAKLSPAEQAITELGIKSNLFRADCSQDAAKDFTKENLQNYDIVLFYTTGNLPIKPEDLDYFFKEWLTKKGHGFIGTHSAADTYHNYQPYWDMIGGTFNGHPWGSGDTVTVSVHDTKHPVSKPWGEEFSIKDEIYRFKNWQPDKVRVLMSLNMAKSANKIDEQLKNQANDLEKKGKPEEAAKVRARIGEGPYHVPIAWVKNYGEGKAMHMSLGHNEAVWADERYMDSLLAGIKWELNLVDGDATPNPDVSAEQEKKSKAEAIEKNK
ncbi:ThuA domain-containing protein [Anatilimnocola sp. NA78]|uniref:ThuA domain-containing protein n=1 Tax=Anatilimnocola sp. NA78 TaxID=3415683 RepID=UPI003CE569C3